MNEHVMRTTPVRDIINETRSTDKKFLLYFPRPRSRLKDNINRDLRELGKLNSVKVFIFYVNIFFFFVFVSDKTWFI